jgi:hypothetical protein
MSFFCPLIVRHSSVTNASVVEANKTYHFFQMGWVASQMGWAAAVCFWCNIDNKNSTIIIN